MTDQSEIENWKQTIDAMMRRQADFVDKMDKLFKSIPLAVICAVASATTDRFRTATKPQLFKTNYWN